jgi:hypothetical protein
MSNNFSLESVSATVKNVNNRPEIHGEDFKPAHDVDFVMIAQNTFLDLLHPELRHSLTKRDGDKPELDLDDHTPIVKFDHMDPIQWVMKLENVRLSINHDQESITLMDCKINKKWKIELLNGGSCKVEFQVQTSILRDEDRGILTRLGRQNVKIDLDVMEEAVEDEPDQDDFIEDHEDDLDDEG